MKKCTKNLAAATIIVGIVAASQSVFAQVSFVKNDLYMGFQNSAGGGTADYIINLGPASSIVGGSSVVNLSADVSKANFTSAQLAGTTPSDVEGGVVGGSNGDSPSDVFATVLRTSNIGTPSLAGSTAPAGLSRGTDNSTYTAFSQIVAPAAGSGVLDTTKSWESFVEPTYSASSYYGNCGINPDSPVTTSSIVYEDLWQTTNSSITGIKPFVYQGYFTLNFTGGTASVTFTPLGAPNQLASKPQILSITKTGTTVTVVSTAVSTFHYQLQSTASLNPPAWVNVGSAVLASGTLVTNTDASATTSPKFYQVTGH